jgi:hypothetical protein
VSSPVSPAVAAILDLEHRHADGIANVIASHDAWCPAVDHASQLILRPSRP